MHHTSYNTTLQKMKSMQTKAKSKGKFGKLKFCNKDTNCTSNPDLSNLRKPIDTSLSSLCQISKLLENGTDEVKSILSYECDVLYECRICRSLFRSIINLISHKRQYCKEKFNIALHRGILNDYDMISAKGSVIHICKTEQMDVTENTIKNDRILRSQVPKEPHKKDLSTVVDMLNKKRKINMENNCLNELKKESAVSDVLNDEHIYLESINTNCPAMYQTVKSSSETVIDTSELMKGQVIELQNMADQHTIMLEGSTSESHLEKSDSPIQIDVSDEDNDFLADRPPTNNLICSICNAKFSTKKTLTFHMKTLHTSQRMCYPCPCCTSTFANTWSVHRHLFKVHRKTNEQVRKLRPHIQEKAFQKEILVENLRKASIKTSTLENITTKKTNKTQQWVDYLEPSPSQLQNCKCGKTFDKKIAYATHLEYCSKQVADCNEITSKVRPCNKTSSDSLSVLESNTSDEIKDVNIVHGTDINKSIKKNILNVNSRHSSLSPELYSPHEISIRVQAVSSLSKEDWDLLENNYLQECKSINNNKQLDMITTSSMSQNKNESLPLDENRDYLESNETIQSPENIYVCTDETNSLKIKNKKRKLSNQNRKQLINSEEKNIMKPQKHNSRLESLSDKMDQTLLMENKIATLADLRKLQCLPCKRKFTSMTNLRRHMAGHIGWNRYRCKLCDFKCFVKCDCVAHCNKVHKAQNNRAVIAEMVAQIPCNEYTCKEDIFIERNIEENIIDSDMSDTPVSSSQQDININVNDSSDITLQNKIINTEQLTESDKKIEYQNIDAEDSNETTKTHNLPEYMMNCGSGKLDAHPDLQRMIMEVIFGPSDITATEQTDTNKPMFDNTNSEKDINIDNENDIISSDGSKETLSSDNSKPQRPMRNRIKPLNEDFVYDLKECNLFKGSSFQLGKSLTKKSSAFI